MRVVTFGATGMVGSGVLLECLEDDQVESVLVVGRRSCGRAHAKLDEIVQSDLFDLDPVADRLAGYDACFYCLGVSSAGMSEADYRRITYDLTVAVVDALVRANPDLKVCFVSGQGTDGTASGRVMWARVKGEAENYLLGLPFDAYMFRPGFIQPLKGVRSQTALYQTLYTVARPLYPVLRRLFPDSVTTSVVLGRAMIRAAARGYRKRVLETADINELGSE
jgi:uncharacterized protein YbjT (DUF2867 family)